MSLKKPKMALDDAEALALQGLTFLAADTDRLSRFMRLTGIEPAELKSWAGAPHLQAAVLEHLLGDESLLLVFAADTGAAPESLTPALRLLEQPG